MMYKETITQYVKNITAGRLASGFSHCYRVYHLARELDVDNYDDEILFAACFLHDTVLGFEGHLRSAEKAEQILQEVGFPANKINAVYETIRSHWPEDGIDPVGTEGTLLHDANLIDSLGAMGVIRLSIGSFYWYNHKTLTETLNLIKQYRERARLLMLPKSKKIAKEKIAFMDQIIAQIEKEYLL